MAGSLTRAVLAGGSVFPVGTVREGRAAEVVPDGDWWSDFTEHPEVDESADVDESIQGDVEGETPEGAPVDGEPSEAEPNVEPDGNSAKQPQEPPRSGAGSGVGAWREYAAALGVEHPEDASRDEIVALIDSK